MEYGKMYHKITLAETIEDPVSGECYPNRYAIRPTRFETPTLQCDGKEIIAVHRASGRYLLYCEEEGVTLIMRLLTGKDSREQQRISTLPDKKRKRMSSLIELRTVGIFGKAIDSTPPPSTYKPDGDEEQKPPEIVKPVEDWRTAVYRKPPEEFFLRMSYADLTDILEVNNVIDGGIESDLDEACPLCGESLHSSLTKSTRIPFLGRDFFSKASRRKW
jgi:hypothetical protein